MNWRSEEAAELDTCDRMDELMRTGEQSGRISAGGLALVTGHVGQCRRCTAAYGRLIPLLPRDAGQLPGLTAPAGQPSEPFTDRLMERIAAEGPADRRVESRRQRRAINLPLALAASAVLLVAAGFLAWRLGFPSKADEVLVRFGLVAPGARSVALVGDFNGWNTCRQVLKDATGEGTWQIAIWLKEGQTYTYNFLIDGQR